VFTVTVRDHIMVAHSFTGEVFGPAQRLHAVLAELTYRNLDDEPSFAGSNTTTEVVAKEIANRLAVRIHDGALGEGARRLTGLAVTLHESHVAWASYERLL